MRETVTLNNHVEMPLVGYGVYQIPSFDTKRCVLDALRTGYRLIDTAQYYGNEAGVGAAIHESGIPRHEIFLTTKLKSNRNVAGLIEESLETLQTEYIDLLLIHWVMGNDLATYRVMEEYYKHGKVRAIGLSNFYSRDYEHIINHCEIRPAVNQLETHVFRQNRDVRALYKKDGTYLEAWAPFGEGKANMFTNPTLASIASKQSRTVAQVILRFSSKAMLSSFRNQRTQSEWLKTSMCSISLYLKRICGQSKQWIEMKAYLAGINLQHARKRRGNRWRNLRGGRCSRSRLGSWF